MRLFWHWKTYDQPSQIVGLPASNHNPSESIAAAQAVDGLKRSVASGLSEHNPEITVTSWT
jgi:hypothetical protein